MLKKKNDWSTVLYFFYIHMCIGLLNPYNIPDLKMYILGFLILIPDLKIYALGFLILIPDLKIYALGYLILTPDLKIYALDFLILLPDLNPYARLKNKKCL